MAVSKQSCDGKGAGAGLWKKGERAQGARESTASSSPESERNKETWWRKGTYSFLS